MDVGVAARVWCDRNARPSSAVLVTVVVWGPRVVLVGQRLAHRVCNKCLDSLSAASGFSVDSYDLAQSGVGWVKSEPSVVPQAS